MNQLQLLTGFVGFVFRHFTHVEVIGLENMPKEGGCIVCVNHIALIDPAVIFMYSGRRDLSALVAKKHQSNRVLRWIVDVVGGIWLNRDEADTHAIRASQDFLRQGGCLGLAPEGTRSATKTMIEAKTGAAYLAEKAQVPIVPVGLAGTETLLASWKRLRKPQIQMIVGKPFMLQPVDRKDRDAGLKRNTDEIMCRIATLLPEKYHGFYAGHPRLRELQAK